MQALNWHKQESADASVAMQACNTWARQWRLSGKRRCTCSNAGVCCTGRSISSRTSRFGRGVCRRSPLGDFSSWRCRLCKHKVEI